MWDLLACRPRYGAAGRRSAKRLGCCWGQAAPQGADSGEGSVPASLCAGTAPPRVLDAGPAHPKGAPAITEPGGGNGDNQGDGTGEGPILGPDSRGTPRQRRRDAGDRRRVEADPGRRAGSAAGGLRETREPPPGSGTHLAGDVVHVGAGVAGETVAALSLLHDEPIPAAGAEEQHDRRPAGSRRSRRACVARAPTLGPPPALIGSCRHPSAHQ